MPLEDCEKRRIAKAIWAYSGLGQKEFAEAAGLTYDRLRAALNDEAKSPPSTDELLAMAEAAEVPRSVALNGWASSAEPDLSLMQAQITELATGLAALSRDTLRNTQELQAIRDTGHQTPRSGEGP